jgi:hypothetical protein
MLGFYRPIHTPNKMMHLFFSSILDNSLVHGLELDVHNGMTKLIPTNLVILKSRSEPHINSMSYLIPQGSKVVKAFYWRPAITSGSFEVIFLLGTTVEDHPSKHVKL